MIKNRRNRKDSRVRTLLAYLALLGWFIPVIVLIVYGFFVRGFLPTDRFFNLSLVLSSVVAVALTLTVLPNIWNDTKAEYAKRNIVGLLKASTFSVFVPIFCFMPLHVSVSHFIPYALHLAAGGQYITIVEPVSRASYGSRHCPRPAILEDDHILLHRRVCGLTPEENRFLERGGSIELQGTMSPYGFQISRYRIPSVRG